MTDPILTVPYTQDVAKWKAHYLKKGMQQLKTKEMMQSHKEPSIKTNLVLPTTQLVAQAKAELKREQKGEQEVYAPIKVTPEFSTTHSSTSATGGSTSRKRKASKVTSAAPPAKKTKPPKRKTKNGKGARKNNKGGGRDIFHI